MESLRYIVINNRVMLIGVVIFFFESVMYIFVFLWISVLDRVYYFFFLGIVFLCFMLCVTLGSFFFNFIIKNGISLLKVVILIVIVVSLVNIGVSFVSANYSRSLFMMFIILELVCGVYFLVMGWLR